MSSDNGSPTGRRAARESMRIIRGGKHPAAAYHRRSLARYAAGLAVAAHALGYSLRFATVLPAREDDSLVGFFREEWDVPAFTFVKRDDMWRPSTEDEQHAYVEEADRKNRLIIAQAGELAAYDMPGSSGLFDMAFAEEACRVIDEECVGPQHRRWMSRLESLQRQARTLVRKHAPAVDALTEALVERGRLTGDEAQAVIEGAMPKRKARRTQQP